MKEIMSRHRRWSTRKRRQGGITYPPNLQHTKDETYPSIYAKNTLIYPKSLFRDVTCHLFNLVIITIIRLEM